MKIRQNLLDLISSDKPMYPIAACEEPQSLRTVGICAAIMIGIAVATFAAIYLQTGVL